MSASAGKRKQPTAAEVQEADQAAWEAPDLRPVFTPFEGHEPWRDECPSWCDGSRAGHEPYTSVANFRNRRRYHSSEPLRVRQDLGPSYYSTLDRDEGGHGTEGVSASHLELSLFKNDRGREALVEMVLHYGETAIKDLCGNERQLVIGGWHLDEVRELIVALQHLLKEAQDD